MIKAFLMPVSSALAVKGVVGKFLGLAGDQEVIVGIRSRPPEPEGNKECPGPHLLALETTSFWRVSAIQVAVGQQMQPCILNHLLKIYKRQIKGQIL